MTNTRIRYQPVCTTCGQSAVIQGKRGAVVWKRGHEQLSGHLVAIKQRRTSHVSLSPVRKNETEGK